MWVRVALNKESIKTSDAGNKYIDGDYMEEYYFGKESAAQLDKDGFLKEMWETFDAMFDWGDCDFFDSDKCKLFAEWLKERLSRSISDDIRNVYSVMYDYALKAIKNDTGLYFDF